MPVELPYLASYKNVATLFDKIKSAKIPDAFTTGFLEDIIGLKSSNDRALITLLKTLGFLDASGKPTSDYSYLKNEKEAKIAIANAIRKSFEPLFAANEKAHELPTDEIRGLVAQVAGSDDNLTTKIVGTFKALSGLADFSIPAKTTENNEDQTKKKKEEDEATGAKKLRPDFHYNIQVHLPTNGSEETYINIFNAIRKVFK
jgi:hypothetical protein